MRLRTLELPTRPEDPVRFAVVFDRLTSEEADTLGPYLNALGECWGAVGTFVCDGEVDL